MIAVMDVNKEINKTKHNIMFSKQNRDSRRCENFDMSAQVVTINAITMSVDRDIGIVIELRYRSFSDLQDQCFSLSYQFIRLPDGFETSKVTVFNKL
jgi:hypothetical protein